MEKDAFCQWLENSVILHGQLVNQNDFSLLILDNHGPQFSVDVVLFQSFNTHSTWAIHSFE